jgi:hypothetical protein
MLLLSLLCRPKVILLRHVHADTIKINLCITISSCLADFTKKIKSVFLEHLHFFSIFIAEHFLGDPIRK